jgi:hypothetical protein
MDTQDKYIEENDKEKENNETKINIDIKNNTKKFSKIKFLEDENDYCEILFLTGC